MLAAAGSLQECLKALSLYRFDAVFVEPLLRERQAIPAASGAGRETSFHLDERRVLQSGEFREEGVHEQSKLR